MPGSRLVRGKAMRGGTGPAVFTSGPRKLRVSAEVELAPNVRLPLSLTKTIVQDRPKNGNENPPGKPTWIEEPLTRLRAVEPAGPGGVVVLTMIEPTSAFCPAPTVIATGSARSSVSVSG